MLYNHYLDKQKLKLSVLTKRLDAYVKLHKIRASKGMKHVWITQYSLYEILPSIRDALLSKSILLNSYQMLNIVA